MLGRLAGYCLIQLSCISQSGTLHCAESSDLIRRFSPEGHRLANPSKFTATHCPTPPAYRIKLAAMRFANKSHSHHGQSDGHVGAGCEIGFLVGSNHTQVKSIAGLLCTRACILSIRRGCLGQETRRSKWTGAPEPPSPPPDFFTSRAEQIPAPCR